jgi:hypothetical protein
VPNVGHGWVFEREDGHRNRKCGGPALCPSCAEQAALKAGHAAALFGAQAAARGRLTAVSELLHAKEPVSRALILEHLDLALADLQPPLPVEEDYVEARAMVDERVHSWACGIRPHGHGRACHRNCPTCHGEEES